MFSPPTSLPSLLNPTSMAGHRQPIKPGLGGYLHTLGCSKKVSEHAQSRPAPFTNFFSSFFSVSHSFHLSLYFTGSHVYILPFALSFQSPHAVSSSHNVASRNYSFCWSSSANSQCPLPTSPFIPWLLCFFAVMIMTCAPPQWQSCACGRVSLCEFTLYFLQEFGLF